MHSIASIVIFDNRFKQLLKGVKTSIFDDTEVMVELYFSKKFFQSIIYCRFPLSHYMLYLPFSIIFLL